jgi:hypothetical protein
MEYKIGMADDPDELVLDEIVIDRRAVHADGTIAAGDLEEILKMRTSNARGERIITRGIRNAKLGFGTAAGRVVDIIHSLIYSS